MCKSFCLLMAELERKMSTRRTRQELIEQGVLKEVPDNGKSAPVIHPISRHNSAWQQRSWGCCTHTDSTVKSSAHYSRNTVLSSSRCLKRVLKKGKFTFTLLVFKVMWCLLKCLACHSPERRKSGTNSGLQQNSIVRGVYRCCAGPAVAEAYLLNLQLLLHHTNKQRLCAKE